MAHIADAKYERPVISAERLKELTTPHYAKEAKPAFRIAQNKQRWHDFTLNRGHVYGTFKGGYYVSTGEIVRRENKDGEEFDAMVIMYERGTRNMFRWYKTYIPVDAPLCRAIQSCIDNAPAWYRGMEYYTSLRDCKNMMQVKVKGHQLTSVVG